MADVPYVFTSTGPAGAPSANDIITAAFRRLGILQDEQEMSDADAANGLTKLNDMMHGFGPMGIKYAHTTLALTDAINMPDELIDSLKWMMADDLVDDYGVQLTPRQELRIVNAKNQLQAAYWVQPPADTDPMLRPPPRRFDITRGE